MTVLQLTPLLAASAFAVGYGLGWMVMRAIADGSFAWPQRRRSSSASARASRLAAVVVRTVGGLRRRRGGVVP